MKTVLRNALFGAVSAALLLVQPAFAGGDRTLNVFAAASLTDAFRRIGRTFEAAHPGVRIRFNFAASNILALQIKEGAPADVFASAAMRPAVQLHEAGLTDTPTVFTRNRLVVVTPRDNPAQLRDWTDITRGGVKLVLAAPGVPAGNYAREVLARAEILPAALQNLVSNEPNVRAILSKVAMGEADAGMVYASDARVRRGVIAFTIPDEVNIVAEFPIAATGGATDTALARAFVDAVMSPASQALLRAYGFIPARSTR